MDSNSKTKLNSGFNNMNNEIEIDNDFHLIHKDAKKPILAFKIEYRNPVHEFNSIIFCHLLFFGKFRLMKTNLGVNADQLETKIKFEL